jgi:hypothetical protein
MVRRPLSYSLDSVDGGVQAGGVGSDPVPPPPVETVTQPPPPLVQPFVDTRSEASKLADAQTDPSQAETGELLTTRNVPQESVVPTEQVNPSSTALDPRTVSSQQDNAVTTAKNDKSLLDPGLGNTDDRPAEAIARDIATDPTQSEVVAGPQTAGGQAVTDGPPKSDAQVAADNVKQSGQSGRGSGASTSSKGSSADDKIFDEYVAAVKAYRDIVPLIDDYPRVPVKFGTADMHRKNKALDLHINFQSFDLRQPLRVGFEETQGGIVQYSWQNPRFGGDNTAAGRFISEHDHGSPARGACVRVADVQG